MLHRTFSVIFKYCENAKSFINHWFRNDKVFLMIFWVVQLVELILTLGSSKDAKEVIFPEMGELSNPVCEHVNFCFTLRFRLASHSDRNHLGGLGIETKMIRPKQTFGFLAFIIRDFLFTLKGKSSWFIDVGDLPFDMKIAVFVLICLRGFLGTPKKSGKIDVNPIFHAFFPLLTCAIPFWRTSIALSMWL